MVQTMRRAVVEKMEVLSGPRGEAVRRNLGREMVVVRSVSFQRGSPAASWWQSLRSCVKGSSEMGEGGGSESRF